jgi:hypothetical protein
MNPGIKNTIPAPHLRNLVVWPFARTQADGATPLGWTFKKAGGAAEPKLSATCKPSSADLSAKGGHFLAVITANPDVDSYISIPVSIPDPVDSNRTFSVSFNYSYTGTLAAGDIQVTAYDGVGEIVVTTHLVNASVTVGAFLEEGTNLSNQTFSGRFTGAGNIAQNWELRLKIKGAAVALSALKISDLLVASESAESASFHNEIVKVAQLWALVLG